MDYLWAVSVNGSGPGVGFVRRAAKVDDNQREIISALRHMGCSVTLLHQVGGGCPDLLVGHQKRTILLEVKNPQGRNRILPEQEAWHNAWQGGPCIVVRTVEEALAAVR